MNPSLRAGASATVLRTSCVLIASTLVITSCSSDDDGGGTPPAPNLSTTFDATLAVQSGSPLRAVRVTVRNSAPTAGTFQTPVWIGLHDGTFDLYDSGSAASAELESLAEDGSLALLGTAFGAASGTGDSAVLGGVFGPAAGPIPPYETVSHTFLVDPAAAENQYLSWASMVIPSNDAFVANGDPLAHPLFTAGALTATDFTVLGTDVLDAGTEVNDEDPTNTAFFGQAAPNTGTAEGGTVGNHVGFLPVGSGGILADPMFSGADFENVPGYTVLDVTIEDVTSEIVSASGGAVAVLDPMNNMLSVDLAATNLSSDATAVELRRGAAGSAGTLLLDLTSLITTNSGGTTVVNGDVAVTLDQLNALRNSNTHFAVKTALRGDTEVRGQIRAANAATAVLESASTVTPPIAGEALTVNVQNVAPAMGTFQTPVWVGLHNGSFDMFDNMAMASAALERIAEDGDAAPLGQALVDSTNGSNAGLVFGPDGPLGPGDVGRMTMRVNPSLPANEFLSWASMILPSNDAFIGNEDPQAHPLYVGGAFMGAGFTVVAADALDAGTEVNDELPMNTAFFGQSTPNTGDDQNGTVEAHPGFLPAGSGGILADPQYAGADFANTAGYEFLRVSVASAPGAAVNAVGTASVRVANSVATVRVAAAGLTGPATAVELRNGAAGVDGPVLLDLTSEFSSDAQGAVGGTASVAVDMAFMQALEAGEVYVSIATALNPGGEVRGQVSVAP